ncbi:MAG: BREX system ATP-binding domain-containing protein [Thermomicrobiales bacterium]
MTASEIIAGARVRTADFGAGTVIETLPDGALVRCDDYGGMSLLLTYDTLSAIDAPHATPRVPLGPPPGRRVGHGPPPPGLRERQAIEALRFGLVPYAALDELTLGYRALREWICSRLPDAHDGAPQVSAIFGPFGAGKSHTMAVIRRVAAQRGYLTARVEVDGNTVSLAEPAKLLHALWSTLRGENFQSATPLLDLYVAAAKAGRPAPTIAPRGMDRPRNNYLFIAEALRRGKAIDEHGYALEDVLSSSPTSSAGGVQAQLGLSQAIRNREIATFKPMIGPTVEHRPYDFVETLAGHATVARLAGYQGIALTIDEFEVDRSLLTPAKQVRLVHLLQVLQRYLDDETDHPAAPLALFFATIGEDDHSGDRVIEQLIGDRPEVRYDLQPWQPQDLRDLAGKIDRLYTAAYRLGESIDDTLVAQVESDLDTLGVGDSGLIRAFIKRYVGTLDVHYGPPEA